MSTGLKLRQNVLDAKAWLTQERAKLRQQHAAGALGMQVCAHLTDLLDHVVLDLYQAAINDLADGGKADWLSQIALVAHGGYGRRDVAPYSDVDLMILHTPSAASKVAPLAKRLLHDLFDAGLMLGQSVRTIRAACALARKDATIFTSLVESRHVAGSADLYGRFKNAFQRHSGLHWRSIVAAIEQARGNERSQYGETVFLLEPNVKRTRGGLRDIQLLRWVGFARYGSNEPDTLQLLGVLSKEDYRALRRASEFLLRVRNELHFHAGKSHDVLDRAEQVRIAEIYGFRGTEGLLPVEQFMQTYFRHTNQVSRVVGHLLSAARPWNRLHRMLNPIVSHQLDGDFRVGPARITATRRGAAKLRTNLVEVLRMADLANLYDKGVADSTWEIVQSSSIRTSELLTTPAIDRFLSLLSHPPRLAEMLRHLHEAGVLEKIIPAFSHARSLLQFNEYHKYTVDEHCIHAVEQATRFTADEGALGAAYRALKQKRTLHLALLIHDLGKGHPEDHSEVGLRIADDVAQRLHLPRRESEALKFLVHKHLMMSHLAFRRDTSDEQLIVRFAVDVGSPEVLQMLFLLTAADTAAVGPGVWNNWKSEVLTDLYSRTMEHLAGQSPSANTEHRRATIRACLTSDDDPEWFNREIDSLPTAYLYGTQPEKAADELRLLKRLAPGEVQAWSRFLPETETVEFTIATQESVTAGIFHKLTGALTSQGLRILSAEIHTFAEGMVLDRFVVQDPDYRGEPPQDRLDDVQRRLAESLTSSSPPAFRKVWSSSQRQNRDALSVLPTQVRADNGTSDRHTILDIFASDRLGLLYTISRTLFEMGLSVSLAKIGTYLDQVVDVFYVTDQSGRKIVDEDQLQRIRNGLLEAITALQRNE